MDVGKYLHVVLLCEENRRVERQPTSMSTRYRLFTASIPLLLQYIINTQILYVTYY